MHVFFTWSIENAVGLLNHKKMLKVVRSPNFFSDADEDTQWYLELYPRGREDNKDYVSLFLTLDCTTQSEVSAAYKLSVVNASGADTHVFKEDVRFCEGDVHGKENIVWRSAILDKTKCLCTQNNTLTLKCEISASKVTHVSRQKRHLPQTNLTHLAEELASFVADARFSDIVFYVRGRQFPAHKVVLAARSPILLSMFEEQQAPSRNNQRIEVKEIEPDVFQQALKYIYTGQVDHLETMAAPLLAIADKYALANLKSICEQSLIHHMNSVNVGSIYMLADVHSAEHLKSEALKLIQQHGGLGTLIGAKH